MKHELRRAGGHRPGMANGGLEVPLEGTSAGAQVAVAHSNTPGPRCRAASIYLSAVSISISISSVPWQYVIVQRALKRQEHTLR